MPGPHQVSQEPRLGRFGCAKGRSTAGVVIRMPVVPPRSQAEVAGPQSRPERGVKTVSVPADPTVGQSQARDGGLPPTQAAESLRRFLPTYRPEVDPLPYGERVRRLPVTHRDDLERNTAREQGLHEASGPEDLIVRVGRHDNHAVGADRPKFG